jgi:hypothetical protein
MEICRQCLEGVDEPRVERLEAPASGPSNIAAAKTGRAKKSSSKAVQRSEEDDGSESSIFTDTDTDDDQPLRDVMERQGNGNGKGKRGRAYAAKLPKGKKKPRKEGR